MSPKAGREKDSGYVHVALSSFQLSNKGGCPFLTINFPSLAPVVVVVDVGVGLVVVVVVF